MADADYALRHCNGCGHEKPLTAEFFHAAKGAKTGFRFRCKQCEREASKLRQRVRLSDPNVYAEVLAKNNQRAREKRGPRPPIPTEIACAGCDRTLPATTEFFSPRKEGRLKLLSKCKGCTAQAAREIRKNDPEARARHIAMVTRYQKRRLAEDPVFKEHVRQRANAAERRRRSDPIAGEKERAADRAWYHADPERNRARNKKNLARNSAYQARRIAAKLQATPSWAEHDKIAALYEECRALNERTGVRRNVDHILPLQGKTVCGLHVLANLRIVTEFENKSKSNKLIEELCTA